MADTGMPEQGTTQAPSGADYKPPETQEALDRIIGERVARERAKYADYTDLKAKAQRLAEIEEAGKSEAQKSADAISKLTAELDGYKAREQRAV